MISGCKRSIANVFQVTIKIQNEDKSFLGKKIFPPKIKHFIMKSESANWRGDGILSHSACYIIAAG